MTLKTTLPRASRPGVQGSVAPSFRGTSPPSSRDRHAGSARRLPENWRDQLPQPEAYYRAHVERLGARHASDWAQGRCPFHDDRTASLSVHLGSVSGGWRCFAGCGSGDLLGFHMRLTGLGFAEAARDLLRGAR